MMKPSAVYSRETTTKFGKIWRSLAAKWQGSPTSTDHETGHIWCFQSYLWTIRNNRLLAVVFNCKHQSFIACKFSNRCFFVQLCTGNVRRTSRAFQRLGPCLLSSWQHQDLVQKDGGLYSTLMYVDDGGTPTWFPKSWGYPQINHFNRIFMEVMMVMMMMVMILITTLKIILLLLLIWMLMLMVVVMMTSKDCLAMTLIKWVWLKLIHTATLVCGSNGILGRQTQNKSNAIFVIFRYWSPFQAPNYILQVHIFTHMFYTSLYEHLIVHSIYIYIYICIHIFFSILFASFEILWHAIQNDIRIVSKTISTCV